MAGWAVLSFFALYVCSSGLETFTVRSPLFSFQMQSANFNLCLSFEDSCSLHLLLCNWNDKIASSPCRSY